MANKSTLIIDDDQDDIDILCENCHLMFENAIICFDNTVKATQYIMSVENESLPALIITDWRIPKDDIFEFISYIKSEERFKHIKIAILSGSVSNIEKKEFESLGVHAVFEKPFSIEGYKELCLRLRGLLDEFDGNSK